MFFHGHLNCIGRGSDLCQEGFYQGPNFSISDGIAEWSLFLNPVLEIDVATIQKFEEPRGDIDVGVSYGDTYLV